ncbi:MAG TPA: class I SAM-dependent methyltransferase [Planctomycetota bacterium]|nr:class I SAM-dependent methyltransferase [Planctomycetota bacterium]
MGDRSRGHAEKHVDAAGRWLGGVRGPVVDLGCGEGLFAPAAAEYVGLDRDPACARHVRGRGRRAIVAELSAVPLRDGSCGGVLCVNALHLPENPRRVLEEIDRILRPGGRAYVKNDWYKSPHGRGTAFRRELSRWAHRTAYLWHRLASPGTFVVRRTERGRAVCPHCFARFFRERRYRVRRESRYVFLLEKG